MIELLVIKIQFCFSRKKNLAHNAYEWARKKWNKRKSSKKKRLEWMWAKFMIQTIRHSAINVQQHSYSGYDLYNENFNIHCIKYDIILHQLNWSAIANVNSSFALEMELRTKERKIFRFTRTPNRFVFDILYFTNSFNRHSVFIVFICIVLESQRNQDVANILHVFTYSLREEFE